MLKFKIIGLALALVLVAGLVAVASGATGAYFSDTESRHHHRRQWAHPVKIDAGVNADLARLNFGFDQPAARRPQYRRPCTTRTPATSVQDVYVGLPEPDALSRSQQTSAPTALSQSRRTTGRSFALEQPDRPSGRSGAAGSYRRDTVNDVPSRCCCAERRDRRQRLDDVHVRLRGQAAEQTAQRASTGPRRLEPVSSSGRYPTNTHGLYDLQSAVRTRRSPGNGLPFQIVATQRRPDSDALVHPPLTPVPDWYCSGSEAWAVMQLMGPGGLAAGSPARPIRPLNAPRRLTVTKAASDALLDRGCDSRHRRAGLAVCSAARCRTRCTSSTPAP